MTRSAREAIVELMSETEAVLHNPDRILARLSEMGFVVVPREPTVEMVDAAMDRGFTTTDAIDAWCTMLAAIDGKK